MNRGALKIWLLYLCFFLLFLVNFRLETRIGPTPMMWMILNAGVFVLAVYILLKKGIPNCGQIITSLGLGLLMFVAYQGFSLTAVVTFSCSLATFTIFNNYKANAIKFLKAPNGKGFFSSMRVGLLVGTILGIINLFLGGGGTSPELKLVVFTTAISPAVYEEIALRAFIYAFCLYLLKGVINTKFQSFTCYFMMVIPHVMIHTPDQFINYGLVSGVISIIMLTCLFGLPLAYLQRKSDLTSAMIAHGVVMVIRFLFCGISG